MSLVKQFFSITVIFICASGSLTTQKQSTECCEEYCYEEDTSRPQYKHLGVYTPYAFVKGNDSQIYNIPGCTAEKIWMLVRHGSRLLEAWDNVNVEDLEKLRDEIVLLHDDTIPGHNLTLPDRGRLCEADFNLIKNWKWDTNFTEGYEGTLSVSGWNELKDLGKDYRNTFPDIFGNAYSSETLRFTHTDMQRTEATYKAFVEGLYGDGSYNDITLDRPPNPNKIQSPFEFCEAYNVMVQNGPNSETAKFRNSEIFRKLRNDVSVKLGFSESAFQPLSDRIIVDIYDMCRFEISWNVEKSSPWCSVLTPSQFKILEYHDDLNYYMKRSYGFAINSKVFCSGMAEMLNHLATTGASPKVVAYFGHTYGYHAYLTGLGAFKDDMPLRGDNFVAMANRKWKNSEFNQVASNIAAVKYNCPSDAEENVKVKFFVNQKTLNFDWCDSSGVCKLSDVLKQYSLFRNSDCEEIFCSSGNSSGDRLCRKMAFIIFFSMALVAIILK